MKISKLVCTLFGVLLLLGCSKDDSNGGGANPNNYDYYITGKANGQSFSYGFKLNSGAIAYMPSGGGGQFLDISNNNCVYNYEPGFYENTSADNMLTIGFNFNRHYQGGCGASDETSIFNGLFPVGAVTYASNSGVKGIQYTYSPSGVDKDYSTYGGDQANSTFQITSSTEDNSQNIFGGTDYSQNIEGTFSCTLYNAMDPSDKIEITEGAFRLNIEARKQ